MLLVVVVQLLVEQLVIHHLQVLYRDMLVVIDLRQVVLITVLVAGVVEQEQQVTVVQVQMV